MSQDGREWVEKFAARVKALDEELEM